MYENKGCTKILAYKNKALYCIHIVTAFLTVKPVILGIL